VELQKKDVGYLVICECKCGWKGPRPVHLLKRPRLSQCSLSCGLPDPKLADRAGERWGRWTVLEYAGPRSWLCQCDCGVVKKVDWSNLKSGRTQGCSRCYHLREGHTQAGGQGQ